MSLTIHGAHGSDVWVEVNGNLFHLTTPVLATMRNQVRDHGTTLRSGVLFDESDVTQLVAALTGPHLDDCADCEGPALINIEGRIVCPEHAAGYGAAEEWAS